MHLRTRYAVAAAASAVLTVASVVAALPEQPAMAASSGGISVAYYDQWSIYANNVTVKDLVTSGEINHINYLIYDFENINPTTLQCFEAEKATDPDPAGENDPNAGDGAEDVDADYGKDFTAAQAVNGQADTFGQLAGNFHQLQELKAEFPNLKILLSLGGWTYSKYFSSAAASASSRQSFVSSCINMFIKGNLPPDTDFGVTPAAGAIAGLFDGFDIDWEYPGSSGGHLGNITSPNDTQNYTSLLQEFRSELNTLTQSTGKQYYLSAALPAGQDKIDKIQTNQIAQYLDFGDLMTYDMHGGFETTGPSNFQDPLYNDPNDPSATIPPGNEKYSISNAVKAWVSGDSQYSIPGGFPASKLTMGMPFYYRGWTGVPAGSNHGLFQTASGPSAGATYSGNVPGIQMYKELTSGPYSSGSNILNTAADTFYDPNAGAAYFYDGTNFWTGLSPQSIQADVDYLHCQGMAGVMMFSMYDLDPNNPVLFNDVESDLGTTPSSCGTTPPPPGNDFSVALSPSSGSVTAGQSTTATLSTAVVSGSAQSVSLAATGAPTGVTVSFSPASVTAGASSTMTVSTTSSVASGSYPITITGTATSGSHTAGYTLTVSGGTGSGGGGGALTNGGFESGSLSPWTCQPGGVVVTTPVHSGTHALQVTPTASQTGECDQSVTLSPNTSYTLTGWVQGNYAFIGVSGGATASSWTSASGWTKLTVSFTTGSSGAVTVYVHGWYSQGNVFADDFGIS
ncbi:MAG TPA: glycosyl hydrolase family 18 protein [Streptosporangiaceae bacterium]|nr:glycosyl hydrolase family 18 protein [Streptosporangiaceae bacterium]